MKQLFVLLLLVALTSCSSTYIHVTDAETGELSLLRDSHGLTNVGDTLVMYSHFYGKTMYGKYVGMIPEPVFIDLRRACDTEPSEVLVTYHKCIRVK